eukprot:5891769-Alexandrium_andersonii.AAC.1
MTSVWDSLPALASYFNGVGRRDAHVIDPKTNNEVTRIEPLWPPLRPEGEAPVIMIEPLGPLFKHYTWDLHEPHPTPTQ